MIIIIAILIISKDDGRLLLQRILLVVLLLVLSYIVVVPLISASPLEDGEDARSNLNTQKNHEEGEEDSPPNILRGFIIDSLDPWTTVRVYQVARISAASLRTCSIVDSTPSESIRGTRVSVVAVFTFLFNAHSCLIHFQHVVFGIGIGTFPFVGIINLSELARGERSASLSCLAEAHAFAFLGRFI